MKEGRSSQTAAWVAACRGLGAYLPRSEQLIHDPFGLRLGGALGVLASRTLPHLPRTVAGALVQSFAAPAGVYWMQLRTHVIDAAVDAFVKASGRQLVILGAGYDCRAYRLASLRDAAVFEIDHPATQAAKRHAMERTSPLARKHAFLAWDFEAAPIAELPAALAAIGHDASAPTLTIWEGVTMYLTEPAIDATVRMICALGAGTNEAPSTLVFNYFAKDAVERKNRGLRLAVAALGEPFRFGWDPRELGGWLGARGLALESDREDIQIARDLLPAVTRPFRTLGRHIVLARVERP